MGKLDNKVAIITGSTSGMGRDTAYLFAKEGAKVVVTGRNEERAKAVVEKIKADGGEAMHVIADTADLSSVGDIFNKAMDAYGRVDILMNNAGQLSVTPFMELKLDEWQQVLNVNVTSAILLAQLCAPVMKKNGGGHIINIASVAGCAAHWGSAAYVTSKHAMMGLTKSMAMELGPEIHVNGICPGAIRTAMLDSVGGEEAFGFMVERSPLKRIGAGDEIAAAALFLATDASSFVDGQLIRVDGGVDI
ncbi:MAG: SDR family oxidoreductase [Oscillibacter sp.]|nr:SDR family oxidoreductase [Oscillibacter sp.]